MVGVHHRVQRGRLFLQAVPNPFHLFRAHPVQGQPGDIVVPLCLALYLPRGLVPVGQCDVGLRPLSRLVYPLVFLLPRLYCLGQWGLTLIAGSGAVQKAGGVLQDCLPKFVFPLGLLLGLAFPLSLRLFF